MKTEDPWPLESQNIEATHTHITWEIKQQCFDAMQLINTY